jgi:hypothetical protein
MTAPPSPHELHGEPQAGPQAGSHTGAWHGSACPRHGERNSMNDERRQLLLPKQLLQPGAATKLPRISARHSERDMTGSPPRADRSDPERKGCVVADDAEEP